MALVSIPTSHLLAFHPSNDIVKGNRHQSSKEVYAASRIALLLKRISRCRTDVVHEGHDIIKPKEDSYRKTGSAL